MEIITAVRGFKDILPGEAVKWHFVEQTARTIFSSFGFREIRLPLLEKTELFKRGIGEATDIVEKEMYTFLDKGDEYLTMRPEATAGVIRAYIEHSLFAADPVVKLFTMGPMFRRERPQKGRYRQFHQIDAEVLGSDDPQTDAELIFMLVHLLHTLGLMSLKLEINSLGCRDCRPAFRTAITEFLSGKEGELCGDCQRRLHTNPLRVFDCKVKECQQVLASAPRLLDFLCDACRDHFEEVQGTLTLYGTPFSVNSRMVRGLDYYTRTTFELTTESLGAQNAVVGGGRFDGLVKDLGGPEIAGIGFAIGMERLVSMLALADDGLDQRPLLYIAALGDGAKKKSGLICNRLRIKGIYAEIDYSGKSLKSQMKRADKLGCRYTLIVGDREMDEQIAELRDMRSSSQIKISFDKIEDYVINIAKEN
ncbi:MAG: histidine--tRNA ligase [Smithellaceae bacterium]|nr:histidine--tRNA ligase [Smithellaceae bacterium]